MTFRLDAPDACLLILYNRPIRVVTGVGCTGARADDAIYVPEKGKNTIQKRKRRGKNAFSV